MQANAKGSHKRNLSNGTPDNSPLRRSKRQKSTVNLKEASSSSVSSDEGYADEEEQQVVRRPQRTRKAMQKFQGTSSVKKEAIKETGITSSIAAVKAESTVKTEELGIKVKTEAEAASTVHAKPARKGRKTKEEKEAEAMPLAPRTQGLKMFVGAHVSAAKGGYSMELCGRNVELIKILSSRSVQLSH